ncbi:EamA family transporter [Moraxella sp. ZJ142]|uniref:EamA family transporter n=1 Tax=Moraxella marmotae TaxID=3344520 RepID=UPI0035D513DE
MKTKDWLIIAGVIFAWGINFLFIKTALADVSPMVLGALRFALLLVPAIFFIKLPKCDWRWLALYGLAISFGQFSLMFLAIWQGMPTGLAALLHQSQMFFTVVLTSVCFGERMRAWHIVGMMMAMASLGLIGVGQYQGVLPMMGVWLMLAAGLSWAVGNLIVKKLDNIPPLSLVIWGNVSTLMAFIVVSLILYGIDGVADQIGNLSGQGWLSVLYLVYVAGLLGYSGWGYLLARHPASQITPFALLIPVIALFVGFGILGEKLNAWHQLGAITLMLALVVQVFGGRLFNKNKL